MSTFDAMVRQTAAKYGVPEELALAQMQAESGGNPNAVSSEGAQGLFQIMPATAAWLGVSNPFDPVQSADGGLRYLSQLYRQFGSWDLALAAYNAGPSRIQKGIFPTETKNYVAKIMGAVGLGPPPDPSAGPTHPRMPGQPRPRGKA